MSLMAPEPKKRKNLVICPATWDGMACATILTRNISDVDNHLFCKEDNVAAVFEFPAVKEYKERRNLLVAGLPLPDTQLPVVVDSLRTSSIIETSWYSHHFWSGAVVPALTQRSVHLFVDNQYSLTSRMLIDLLKIEDSVSRAVTFAAETGISDDELMNAWLYVLLAVQESPYDIRHSLAPLFDGNLQAYDPEQVRDGKQVYKAFFETAASTSLFRSQVGNHQAVVVGLPPSFQATYPLFCSMIAEKYQCQIVILFFDSGNQVLIRRGITEEKPIDFVQLAALLEVHLPPSLVRVYDQNMLLIGPVDALDRTIENLVDLLGTLDV